MRRPLDMSKHRSFILSWLSCLLVRQENGHRARLGLIGHCLLNLVKPERYANPLHEVEAGDAVWFAPGEVHWHGAKPGHTMVHMAMQAFDENGVNVVWMEHVRAEKIGD